MTRPSSTGRSGNGGRRSKKDERLRKLRNDQQQLSLFDQPSGMESPRGEGSHGAAPTVSSNPSTRSYGADDQGTPRKQVPEPVEMQLPWLNPQTQIEWDFVAFHQTHPEVAQALAKLAEKEFLNSRDKNTRLIAAGKKPKRTIISMKKLFEQLRYAPDFETEASDFKLNNNYTAIYGRWLIHNYPYLEPFIKLRARKGETPKED